MLPDEWIFFNFSIMERHYRHKHLPTTFILGTTTTVSPMGLKCWEGKRHCNFPTFGVVSVPTADAESRWDYSRQVFMVEPISSVHANFYRELNDDRVVTGKYWAKGRAEGGGL